MSEATNVAEYKSNPSSKSHRSNLNVDKESHEEHLRLASIVKGVHAELCNKYKKRTGVFGSWRYVYQLAK